MRKIDFELRAFWTCPECFCEQSSELRKSKRKSAEWLAPPTVMCRDCGETLAVSHPPIDYAREKSGGEDQG